MSCYIVGYIFYNCRKLLIFQDSFQKSIFEINQPKKKKKTLRQGEKEYANFVYTFRIITRG